MRPIRPIRLSPTVIKVLVAAVVIIALGLLIAQDQETLRIESAWGAADPAFPEYVAALTGGSVTRGDTYEVLDTGDAIFGAMIAAIRGARRRISFETYIYDAGTVGSEFTQALVDAARRGVAVRLVVDAVGAKTMARRDVEALRQAGVRIGTFNPLKWYTLEDINYRTHRKILVVDGATAFTGGVGVADPWLSRDRGGDGWRDTQLKVVGPAVALLEGAFYENWAETAHTSRPALDLTPPPPETRARSLVVWSSPTGGGNAVKLLYLLALAGARRTLDIQSPYFVLDESTGWSLLQARRRGVRIRLLVEGDLTDARPVKYASRQAYDRLLASGVEIHEYQPSMMHVKATVVDGTWSIVGSTNFDNRSFELNDEINVGVADRGLAARLTEDFERDLTRSRRLTLEAWRRRPAADKLREYVWSYFGELF